jgi:hypothetical protein
MRQTQRIDGQKGDGDPPQKIQPPSPGQNKAGCQILASHRSGISPQQSTTACCLPAVKGKLLSGRAVQTFSSEAARLPHARTCPSRAASKTKARADSRPETANVHPCIATRHHDHARRPDAAVKAGHTPEPLHSAVAGAATAATAAQRPVHWRVLSLQMGKCPGSGKSQILERNNSEILPRRCPATSANRPLISEQSFGSDVVPRLVVSGRERL